MIGGTGMMGVGVGVGPGVRDGGGGGGGGGVGPGVGPGVGLTEQKGHLCPSLPLLGRPLLFSGTGVPSFFTQTHWFAKLPVLFTGTEAARQRSHFSPRPPISGALFFVCEAWMPLHTSGPTSRQERVVSQPLPESRLIRVLL